MAEEKEKKEKFVYDPAEYTLRKRLPPKLPKRKIDVYVTRKTNFKAQLDRSKKLLDQGENEIFIHGLGAAISRAINLSLKLKAMYLDTVDISTNTSTVEVVDDYEPTTDDGELVSLTRNTSAVHIRVFRMNTTAPSTSQ